MKEVNETISQRLKRQEKPFSNEWISEFSSLMEFVTANSHTHQVIASIAKEKKDAYASLIHNLQALLKDGKACLQSILKQIKNSDTRIIFKPQIQVLLETTVDPRRIADPMFKFETTYLNYIAGLSRLLEDISKSDASPLVKNYATIGPNLDINLSFSPFLRLCNHDVETLSGLRTKAIWSKWDLLLQWSEWTKNGISPGNHAFKENLSRMFKDLKISEAMQCCGSLFLEHLINMKPVNDNPGLSLKALELYMDKKEQYWIVAHFAGESNDKKPFFIKKLQRSTRSYDLLKLLLEIHPYSSVDFPTLSHTLGELEIKKELKKVFFPHSQFIGRKVALAESEEPIDTSIILAQLSSIVTGKKHIPHFNSWDYHLAATK
jgi:hypothetical protein